MYQFGEVACDIGSCAFHLCHHGYLTHMLVMSELEWPMTSMANVTWLGHSA